MSLVVKVNGGTGAGSKRPLGEPKGDWRCECGSFNAGYHARCMTPGCNRPREAAACSSR